jgi:glycerol-3-phosphate O-acyltransferase
MGQKIEPAATVPTRHIDSDEDRAILILADVRSAAEMSLVTSWARRRYPGADICLLSSRTWWRLPLKDRSLRVVPVRVVWLPPQVGRQSDNRFSAIRAMGPRVRPWRIAQKRIIQRSPDRVDVVCGESATIGELWDKSASETSDTEAQFTEYIRRQATLSCERAERQIVGDRYKVPRLMVDQIRSSNHFRSGAESLASELGMTDEEVATRAQSCLDEMVAVQSPPAIDLFRALMSHLYTRAWTVEVDKGSLDRLRTLNKERALVFLPSHRSYADPLVLAEALHQNNFPRNHVLGGNNLAFWPIGAIGRRAGIVFIRRSFGDDPIYKFAVREYLGHLLSKRFNMEWYIEGGRTRTGKLRSPKYGLLRYLADALQSRPGQDLYLVPVSLVYDQLREVTSIVSEQSGATKKREGLLWLARYVKRQRTNVGTARVTFGEPFSLRDALGDAGAEGGRLEKIAFRVCTGINKVTPVPATSVVTFALLSARGRALTCDQVHTIVTPLLDYFSKRGIRAPDAPSASERYLRSALVELEQANVVQCYSGGITPVWSITDDNHHVAAFYRNGALHHLINRAILELAACEVANAPSCVLTPIEQAWAAALAIRDLLKFEFFFSEKEEFKTELLSELDLIAPHWRTPQGSSEVSVEFLQSLRPLVAHLVVRPFLEAQLVLAERLTALAGRDVPDADLLVADCFRYGRQLVLQGRLGAPDSVSRELYRSALKLAENRNLVAAHPTVAAERHRYLAEVTHWLSRVDRIAAFGATQLEKVLDDNVLS